MGRRSIDKHRLFDQRKKENWSRKLLPHFKSNGLSGYSMDDLAKYLEISKATIYNHFKSKDEIVESVIQLKIKELKGFNDILHNDNLPFLVRYFKGIQYFTTCLTDFSNVFLSDLQRIYPQQWKLFSDFQKECILSIKAYYREGIRKGMFNAINLSLLAMSDEIFFQLLSVPEYLEELNITLDKAFEEYFKMKFNGLLKEQLESEHFLEVISTAEIGN
ncbi:MAG: TetR/AcrR family transcriptional regulator [Bacteroidota bacterium]